jgi:hypothetical protein
MNSAQSNKTPATVKEPIKLRFSMKSQAEDELLKNGDKSINSSRHNQEEHQRVNTHSYRSPKENSEKEKSENNQEYMHKSALENSEMMRKSENYQDLHKSALENSKVINKVGREYGLLNGDKSKEKSAEVTVDYQELSLDSIQNQPQKEKIIDDFDREEIELSVNSNVVQNSLSGLETEPSNE